MCRTRTSHKYRLLAAALATIFVMFSVALAQNRSRSLTLNVTDDSEQAVVGVSVEIRSPSSSTALLQCKTSENGACSFASLPGGSIEVTIKGPFHEVTSRTIGDDGQYVDTPADDTHWTEIFGSRQMSTAVELKSTVAKARSALFELKLASTRLIQSSRFQEGINANSGAVSAFERVSSVDRRTIVLEDGISVLTLAGALRQHLGGGLDKAAEYLDRAEQLTREITARPDYGDNKRGLPDDLLRAKVMLAIQRSLPEEACSLIERAADQQGWLAPDTDDPMLASEGNTQWWSENRLREEFRDLALSIALVTKPSLPRCSDIALKLTVATKGRVLDATTRKIAWLREGVPASYQHYVSDLQEIWDQQSLTFIQQARAGVGRQELEDFMKTPPWRRGEKEKSPEAQKRQELRDHESKLLGILLGVRKGGDTKDKSAAERLTAIRSALPNASAMIEFCHYRPYTGRAVTEASESMFDADRYAAFVLVRDRPSQLVDLGEVTGLDEKVQDLLKTAEAAGDLDGEALASSQEAFKKESAEVFGRVVGPLLPSLGSVQHLIIGPDRALSLVPFAALQMPDGKFAIERFLVTYVAGANDLLPAGRSSGSSEPSVLVGAPNFGHRADKDDEFDSESIARTSTEVTAIRGKLGEGTVLTGSAASKARLRAVRGPWVLHLATHAEADPEEETSDAREEAGRRYLAAEILGFDRSIALAPERPEEHLLRPKVALANANTDPMGGVLSGLELSHLDLRGTQIAVLSACETSLGVIRDDEGVYSLRRALAIAGARTQVTTLWSVDDDATKAIMVGFYGQLTKGRGEALRSAQLSLALGKDLRLRHPYFWAGLQLSGEWSPLGAHTRPPNSPPASAPPKKGQ
jgi:CHAT domain-containing protein